MKLILLKEVVVDKKTKSEILVDNVKEHPKKLDLTLEELDKKLLAASHNLDSISKEEIINYLQTLLKNNYSTLSEIKSLERRLLILEKRELISEKTTLIIEAKKSK